VAPQSSGLASYELQVPGRLAEAPDLGPLMAILVALLVARFLIWDRFTLRIAAAAVTAGFLWTVAADRWGGAIPTLVALVVVWLLTRAVESAAGEADSGG
jgi:hypothetical protein